MCFGRRFNVHERHCGTIARTDTTTADLFIFAGTPGQKFDTLHATISREKREIIIINNQDKKKQHKQEFNNKKKEKTAPDGSVFVKTC
jgi:hypothetical protein